MDGSETLAKHPGNQPRHAGLESEMKMKNVLNQGEETEYSVESEEMRGTWVKNYVKAKKSCRSSSQP